MVLSRIRRFQSAKKLKCGITHLDMSVGDWWCPGIFRQSTCQGHRLLLCPWRNMCSYDRNQGTLPAYRHINSV